MPESTYSIVEGDVWKSIYDKIGDSSGTYRVKLWDRERVGFLPIPRLMGIDEGGTLYIGTSQNIPSRVGTLKKAVLAAYTDGKRYHDKYVHPVGCRINKRFVDGFSAERLRLEVEVHPSIEGNQWSHYEHEARLLNEYWAVFGEFPPMNGPRPDEKYIS